MERKPGSEDKKSLQGRTVMITQARKQAAKLALRLEELGARIVEFPTIKIVPPDDKHQLEQAIERLEEYDWLIFTSINGVKYFFDELREQGKDKQILGEVKIAAIGPATASELTKEGVKAAYVPQEYRAEAIIEGLEKIEGNKITGLKILIPRAKVARKVLPEKLSEDGARVDIAVAYQTVADDSAVPEAKRALEAGEVDIITFTSSSTAKNFVDLLKDVDLDKVLQKVKIVCIGPVTAETAEKLGLRVSAAADEYTIDGLVETLLNQ